METSPQPRGDTPNNNDIWKAYEAVPRDGPAVFVLDTKALDNDGHLHGGWIRFDLNTTDFTDQLHTLLGRTPEAETWSIVDQSLCGPIMVPETFDPGELDQVRSELRETAR